MSPVTEKMYASAMKYTRYMSKAWRRLGDNKSPDEATIAAVDDFETVALSVKFPPKKIERMKDLDADLTLIQLKIDKLTSQYYIAAAELEKLSNEAAQRIEKVYGE